MRISRIIDDMIYDMVDDITMGHPHPPGPPVPPPPPAPYPPRPGDPGFPPPPNHFGHPPRQW